MGIRLLRCLRVQLQGLQPSTIYRVSVRTKHPKAVLEQRPVERCIDFKTLPKIGLPDPPSHVQVEIGPQPGTLLVSWQPVANQPKPPSRAAVHSYLIYADGKNIAQVPQATADHVVLRLSDLSDDPPIFITVRTKTKEGAVSSDSNVARVPRTQPSGPQIDPVSGLPLVDMTSSYPSYQQHNPMVANSMYVPLGSAGTLPGAAQMTNGHVTSAPTSVAPYTAPARMVGATGLMSYQQPSYPSVVQQQQAQPGASGYATFDRSASLGAQPQSSAGATGASILLGAPTRPSSSGQPNQSWKPSQMSQYYTFHPNFLHTEPAGVDEPRPSVLEMENSYLMRHRQASDWANAPESRDARARIEAYSRGLARAGSADDRMQHGSMARAQQQQVLHQPQRLVAPRLARVKSESGFGTRSEPDLRPPTLDSDECRWFVALYDYTAAMSPNPNAEFEELQFRKHQLIKVFGTQDNDGFFQGAIGNRVGLVPSNMVIEIAKDDVGQRRSTGMPAPPPPTAPEPALRRQRWGSLKSRSYDYAGDRSGHRPHPNYVSLDRRQDDRDRERDRYRRGGGAVSSRPDYEYRRIPDDEMPYRRRQPIIDPRDREHEYEDEGYRDRDRDRRDRDRDRDRDRYDRNRDMDRDRDRDRDRRYESRPDERRPRPDDRYDPYREKYRERPRMDEPPAPYRQDDRATYDYPPGASRYDQPGTSQGAQLNHQMSQMQLGGQYMPTQQPQQPQQLQQQPQPMGVPSSSGIGVMGGGGMGVYSNGAKDGFIPKQLVAKFDYDSRQLSPNVDAEQVELSFRQGDIITVLGEMDDDGFYMGELNGVRGLVPSNFLQATPLTNLAPSQPTEPMRKGVAFSDTGMIRKSAPVRQSSQTSAAAPAPSMATAAAAAAAAVGAKPIAKKSSAGVAAGKPLAKKTSDVGKSAAPNARKTSTAVKKSDTGAKKK
uniref:SH3 domain-containing protein n=1 Tax=Caenorhabditis japonica TaxID=281687 RepID=A0A8R1I092_CAEJA